MKIAQKLKQWFERERRDLPWRRTRDPYAIWLSEIMLQQTRVTAVIPYYKRFLAAYPNYEALAAAPEAELLAAWAGLGYYSRARNLQKAAMAMAAAGGFPESYEGIRALPGVGEYTAGAVASIAFGLPEVGIDGNVVRVLSRVTGGMAGLKEVALREMDRRDPGTYQQALMELGATVCAPKKPRCLLCPIAKNCKARELGIVETLPLRKAAVATIEEEKTLLWIEREGSVLVWQRGKGSKRLAGFWELPEEGMVEGAEAGGKVGEFRHSIVNHRYRFILRRGRIGGGVAEGLRWVEVKTLSTLATSTAFRKSLVILGEENKSK